MKNEKQFNKLVRDLIPNIIESKGEVAEVITLSESEFRNSLLEKLIEEAKELKVDPCIEEVADVLEVLETICLQFGFSKDDVLAFQKSKKTKRGGFSKKIFLKKTYIQEG